MEAEGQVSRLSQCWQRDELHKGYSLALEEGPLFGQWCLLVLEWVGIVSHQSTHIKPQSTLSMMHCPGF